jgi:hypothetical protein
MRYKIDKFHNKLTDITPDGSHVNRVVAPYDRVDEVGQTPESRPCHVQTCACIPS